MVGGLVQKQHIRSVEQHLGQFYTHIPPLGERTASPLQFVPMEPQSHKSLLRCQSRGLGGSEGKPVVQVVKLFYQFMVSC